MEMITLKTYNTCQRQELIDFLAKNHEQQYTIEQLSDELNSSVNLEKKVGKSTVYRLINKMLEDGIVRRTVKGTSRQFMYQYADVESCKSHLHMKCRHCGKILHMDDAASQNLMKLLHDNSSFDLDLKDTLLLGKCEKCSISDESDK